jgi:DNA-binding GntR family transcriptional regulator
MVERATAILREEVLAGDLLPGSRIPIEETAQRLQMSPIPVREALRGLASEELVVAVPQHGYRVSQLTRADLEDLFRLRATLDVLAVRLAVPRLREGHLRTLQRELTDLAAAQRDHDWPRQRDHHRGFHFALFTAADSPRLLRTLSTLWDHCDRYLRLAEGFREHPETVGEEHQVLMEACRARDVTLAVRRTREHLEFTRRTAARMLEAQERAEAGARRQPRAVRSG